MRCWRTQRKIYFAFALGLLIASIFPYWLITDCCALIIILCHVHYVGGSGMKVIVIDNPKVLGVVLRKIYGIKKQKSVQS